MEEIILIGGGGHALSIADSIEARGEYRIIGYTDFAQGDCYLPYLGTDEQLEHFYRMGVHNVAVGIGYMGNSLTRDKIYRYVKQIGFKMPSIIDPTSIVSPRCVIGEGSFIGKGACINTGARIGKMCIINTSSIIEHNAVINDFTHVAVGTSICGDVTVSNHVFIGANATVIQGVSIGDSSIIGAGSIVLHNVPSGVTAYGIV